MNIVIQQSVQVGDGLPFTMPRFDALFPPGFRNGELVVWGGSARAGKSWASQRSGRQQRTDPPDTVTMQDLKDCLNTVITADQIVSVSADEDKHAGTFQTVRYK